MEEKEFAALVTRFRPTLKKLSYWHKIPESDMEDLLQEAFIILLMYKSAVIKDLEAFFKSILNNKIRVYYRKKKSLSSDELSDTIPAEDSEATENQKEQLNVLRRAIKRLSHVDKQIIELLLNGDEAAMIRQKLSYKSIDVARAAIARAKNNLSTIVISDPVLRNLGLLVV